MSFKVHLIIISCIVLAVLMAWQFLHTISLQLTNVNPVKYAYNLSITHASWGLNCPAMNSKNDPAQDAFQRKGASNNKLHEDNVLESVSHLCNGKIKCDIPLDEKLLGGDPAADCKNKVLEIEYRCFSYDRPWRTKASSGAVSLHCEQPAQ